MLWDRGTYEAEDGGGVEALRDGYERGDLKITLHGKRMRAAGCSCACARGGARAVSGCSSSTATNSRSAKLDVVAEVDDVGDDGPHDGRDRERAQSRLAERSRGGCTRKRNDGEAIGEKAARYSSQTSNGETKVGLATLEHRASFFRERCHRFRDVVRREARLDVSRARARAVPRAERRGSWRAIAS